MISCTSERSDYLLAVGLSVNRPACKRGRNMHVPPGTFSAQRLKLVLIMNRNISLNFVILIIAGFTILFREFEGK